MDQPPLDPTEFTDARSNGADGEPRSLVIAFGPYSAPGQGTVDEHHCGVTGVTVRAGGAASAGCFTDAAPDAGPLAAGAGGRFLFAPADDERAIVEVALEEHAFVARVVCALYCRDAAAPLWRGDLDWSDPERRVARARLTLPTPGDPAFADRSGARAFPERAVTGEGGPYKLVVSIEPAPGAAASPARAWLYLDVPWIGVTLLGEDGVLLDGERYRVELAGGRTREGALEGGRVTLDRVPAGACRLTFPSLDRAAWALDDRARVADEPARPATAAERVAAGSYDAVDGDQLARVAVRAGHAWRTLLDHQGNAALKRRDLVPGALARGDRVTVPPLDGAATDVRTGARYLAVRQGVPPLLRIQLLDDDGYAAARRPWRLDADGAPSRSGTTDDHGVLEARIPLDARAATLVVGEREYELAIGALAPSSSDAGALARLAQLGVIAADADEAERARALAAVRALLERFREAHDQDAARALIARMHDVL
jgi:hypothetical protein